MNNEGHSNKISNIQINNTLNCFILCVTKLCDKKCLVCCNNQTGLSNSMNFDKFIQKIVQISEFIKVFHQDKKAIRIILTGGESFLYKTHDKLGKSRSIFDLVNAVIERLPTAEIILKTTGWVPNKQLDELFDRVFECAKRRSFSIRLGLNLYQNEGRDAIVRFKYMLERVFKYQDQVLIDSIYDKYNYIDTLKVWSDILSPFDKTAQKLKESVDEDPSEHQGYLFLMKNKVIRLELGPAYSPSNNYDHRGFWDEKNPGPCSRVWNGVDQIFYNFDFSACHCNDSFVDASVPFKKFLNCHSIENEVQFFQKRLFSLQRYLQNTRQNFSTRKERCFFCTKYVLKNE